MSLVFALKLIWRLFTDSESLWGKWVKQTLLRGVSFWDVKEGSTGSWVWKKLLQLRPVAQRFLKMDIHDGKLVKFWTDIWHPIGRLIEIVGDRGRLKLGIATSACIADVLVENEWRFRRTRDTTVQNMIVKVQELGVVLETNVQDEVLWKRKDDEYGREFSAAATWEQIRCKRPVVVWSKLIWFAQGVPRYAFIAWLAVKDRLSTGSKMRAWGQVQCCVFCGEPDETRNHLFFACPYSYTLWLQVIGTLLRPPPSPDWNEIVARIMARSVGSLQSILLRLAFQVSIYYLWKERNERRHGQPAKPVAQLAKFIEKTIRQRIMSTKYYEKQKLKGLMQCWFSARQP